MEVRSAETGSAVGAVFVAVFFAYPFVPHLWRKPTVVVLVPKRLELWR